MVRNPGHLGRLASTVVTASLASLLVAGHCTPNPVVPPRPVPPGDSGQTVEQQCSAACLQLRAVNKSDPCPGYDGAPSPDGVPCEKVCVDTENGDTGRFCPTELTQATTCAEVKSAWEACG
jgi:hypothetical protein